MTNLKFQPDHAKDREEYLRMLLDGIVGRKKNMTQEQYEYEMDDPIIYKGPGFEIFKRYGSEFYVSEGDLQEEAAFTIDEIDETKVNVSSDGKIQVSWDPECSWPTVLQYIEKDGFPIPFKLFKDYGK